jgi:hypothetical protein
MAGLSFAQQRVLEIVAVDGFLLNHGGGSYATAAGKAIPYATIRALIKRGYLKPNDDVLLAGTEPQTLIPGHRMTGRGLK